MLIARDDRSNLVRERTTLQGPLYVVKCWLLPHMLHGTWAHRTDFLAEKKALSRDDAVGVRIVADEVALPRVGLERRSRARRTIAGTQIRSTSSKMMSTLHSMLTIGRHRASLRLISRAERKRRT